MDGTLGSQTAWMLDGSGVRITSGEELEEIVRAGAEAGWPVGVHAIGDRANREALDAFERTRDVWEPRGLRQRIEHAQCLAPEDVPRFARARRRRLGAVHARDLRPRARGALLGRPARRRRTRSARSSTPARSSRTARTRRSRSSTPGRASSPACCERRRPAGVAAEQAVTLDAGAPRHLRRARLALARRAPARHAPPRPARRPRRARPRPVRAARPRSCARCRSSRRWSAAAGCTTRPRGTSRRG